MNNNAYETITPTNFYRYIPDLLKHVEKKYLIYPINNIYRVRDMLEVFNRYFVPNMYDTNFINNLLAISYAIMYYETDDSLIEIDNDDKLFKDAKELTKEILSTRKYLYTGLPKEYHERHEITIYHDVLRSVFVKSYEDIYLHISGLVQETRIKNQTNFAESLIFVTNNITYMISNNDLLFYNSPFLMMELNARENLLKVLKIIVATHPDIFGEALALVEARITN